MKPPAPPNAWLYANTCTRCKAWWYDHGHAWAKHDACSTCGSIYWHAKPRRMTIQIHPIQSGRAG